MWFFKALEVSKAGCLWEALWYGASLCSSDCKESACNAGDLGLIPELGRSPGEENCNPLHYSCLENSMDRPWGHKDLDMTEWLTISLSCGVEGIRTDTCPSVRHPLCRFLLGLNFLSNIAQVCWPHWLEVRTDSKVFSLMSCIWLMGRISGIWHILDTEEIFIRTFRHLSRKD